MCVHVYAHCMHIYACIYVRTYAAPISGSQQFFFLILTNAWVERFSFFKHNLSVAFRKEPCG